MDQGIGLLDIGKIGFRLVGQSRDVIHGVVAQTMACRLDSFENGRMLPDIVAHTEEGGLDAIMRQKVQHPRCDLGCRTIIECEIDALWLRREAPKAVLIQQSTNPGWRLLDKHVTGVYTCCRPTRSTDGMSRSTDRRSGCRHWSAPTRGHRAW